MADTDFLHEQAGDVLGRFALDERSVSFGDLYEAVATSMVLDAQTAEEVFDPDLPLRVETWLTTG